MDIVTQVWSDIQHERECFLKCRLKNIALAKGTYRLPWWARPNRHELAFRGVSRRDAVRWLFT